MDNSEVVSLKNRRETEQRSNAMSAINLGTNNVHLFQPPNIGHEGTAVKNDTCHVIPAQWKP